MTDSFLELESGYIHELKKGAEYENAVYVRRPCVEIGDIRVNRDNGDRKK